MPSLTPPLASLLALALAFGGLGSASPAWATPEYPTGEAEGPRVPLPEVPLVGQDGQPTSPSAWRGAWRWLYLGFIHCPDACPRALDLLAGELAALKAPGAIRPVFLSLDPHRDTPPLLKAYAQGILGPQALGATGPRSSLDAITQALGVRYDLPATAAPGLSYSVGHPDAIFLLDPEGRPRLAWPMQEGAEVGALARASEAVLAQAVQGQTPDWRAASVDTAQAWCGPLANPQSSPEAALMQRARTLGSGTGLQAANSPMRMVAQAQGGWVGMAMGSGWAMAGSPSQGQVVPSAEAWAMGLASRAFGATLLDLRAQAMLGGGTLPSLGAGHGTHGMATGASGALGELSARATQNFGPDLAAFAYGAWGGEGALGLNAHHHRPSAADLPAVPWGLSWLEPSHGALAVATGGLRWQSWQLEASGHLDALGAQPGLRLSWAPGRAWVLSAWSGWALGQGRHGVALSHSSEAAWGLLNGTAALGLSPGQGWAALGEGQWDAGPSHLAARLEALDPRWGPPGAMALSYAHDLGPQDRMSLALGAMVGGQLGNTHQPPAAEARLFLRLRPPLMP